MPFIGKVSNGTVVLPPHANLLEGEEVEVRPVAGGGRPKTGRELAAIWASKSRLPLDEADAFARDVEAGRIVMNRPPRSPDRE